MSKYLFNHVLLLFLIKPHCVSLAIFKRCWVMNFKINNFKRVLLIYHFYFKKKYVALLPTSCNRNGRFGWTDFEWNRTFSEFITYTLLKWLNSPRTFKIYLLFQRRIQTITILKNIIVITKTYVWCLMFKPLTWCDFYSDCVLL